MKAHHHQQLRQRQLQQQQQESPSPHSSLTLQSLSPPSAEQKAQHPKLTIVPATSTTNSTPVTFAEIPSPTLSTSSSLTSSLSSNTDGTGAVSFSFCSPLFYDQKLYIYHSLLKVYRLLGRCIDKHPTVLIVLQYSIAAVHGLTIYLLSVILSVAQLIMITVTIENLDWIQSYTPLMCEWDSRFPGFVFPALDLDSEAEEDADCLASDSRSCKDSLYWERRATLKQGEDLVDDGYQSEESLKRLTVQQSMNSRLRGRFARYQQWMPAFWSADENNVGDSDLAQARRRVSIPKGEIYPYSGDFQRAVTRNKRVTFNEQVQVMGRKRSSEARSPRPGPKPLTYMAPPAYTQDENVMDASLDSFISNTSISPAKPSFLAAPLDQFAAEPPASTDAAQELPVNVADADDLPVVSQDTVASLVVSQMANAEQLEDLKKDEAEYQQSIAARDTNGSGTSSPVLSIDAQSAAVPESTTLLPSSQKQQQQPAALLPTDESNPATVIPASDQSDLRRSSSSSSNNPATSTPQQDNTGRTVSPRSSFSLGTRAKRSISLVVPGTGSSGANAKLANEEVSSLDRRASTGKRNIVYKIVHPQRYKREVEQQEAEQERQRLLVLAQLQRQNILGSGDDAPCVDGAFGTDPVICGDAYYYTTSAEYVEGLGAQDSVISTSIGTSFPKELQGSKSQSKLHPLDCPRAIVMGISGDSPALRVVESLEKKGSQLVHFKRDSKKAKRQGAESNQGSSRIHSSNRLQQLFGGGSQPGQKETRSTSSLVETPGPFSTKPLTGSKESIGKAASKSGSQRLPLPRTTSRQFTTFRALGTPVRHVAQPPSSDLVTSSNGLAVNESDPVASSSSLDMEHTSFSAFGFPSPTQSPESSLPASPRHSTSSMPSDTPSRLQAMNEFYRGTVRRNPFKSLNALNDEPIKQEMLLHELDDDNFTQGLMISEAGPAGVQEGDDQEERVSVESNGPAPMIEGRVLPPPAMAAKSGRGMSFMRKLTGKKK
ncbi:hypothetical protein BGW38_003912 [Lunasporangiospora selenospora]|uniref:Uncharacterized protein n=1 Tax=Lunasporangiospora selenospora TaxID=979761 RepID=A0A9P6KCI2_9FUNG|nr:hypothetical protein BGW38_003912 [Lunasporangiospora selenospora]